MHDDTPRTGSIHGEAVTTMGRRRFMDTLRSLGFGALSASFLTADDVQAASRDEVPVVYGFGRNDEGELEPHRKTVPADWYDDFRGAIAAHRRLDVFDHDGVANSAVEPGEYAGKNAAIRVEVTDDEAHGALPEEIDHVPVEVRRVDASDRHDAPGDSPGSPPVLAKGLPGGVGIASDELYGTLAPALRNPSDGVLYFATSNHVFEGDRTRGDSLYVTAKSGKQAIGTVHEGFPRSDVVCVRPANGYWPLHSIRNGTDIDVRGQFTKAGLADLKAAGKRLEKVGMRSGHSTGKIQAIDGVTCAYGAICKRGQLKWGRESDFTDGDSGSVNYAPDPESPEDGVLVGGLNNARTWWPGENYIWGTAGYRITEQHGYTF
ncbi:hypothetical protein [Halorussus halophilus]|uniref:hypothetical protein n=1 Tax=Halorussus halophilus TaxID=2650975 RepID=UPI00130155E1|nr:hypothetical protein [Halorussus halophilus]